VLKRIDPRVVGGSLHVQKHCTTDSDNNPIDDQSD
jgi:hypothetical protein